MQKLPLFSCISIRNEGTTGQRNAKSYSTPQPRAPWNLEPHVAKAAFLAMLNEPMDAPAPGGAAPAGGLGGMPGGGLTPQQVNLDGTT